MINATVWELSQRFTDISGALVLPTNGWPTQRHMGSSACQCLSLFMLAADALHFVCLLPSTWLGAIVSDSGS